MSTWVMTQTFTGFIMSEAQQEATLSASDPTTVSVSVYLSSTSGNPPEPVCISGGFEVVDPDTGDLVTYSSTVVQAVILPATLQTYNVELVFDPQESTPSVLVKAYAVFAAFAAMP
jgi:hypothetical protein